jgi:hypothetical protein
VFNSEGVNGLGLTNTANLGCRLTFTFPRLSEVADDTWGCTAPFASAVGAELALRPVILQLLTRDGERRTCAKDAPGNLYPCHDV